MNKTSDFIVIHQNVKQKEQLILAIVTATVREENGEFSVAVGPATRTAGTLTKLVKGAGC